MSTSRHGTRSFAIDPARRIAGVLGVLARDRDALELRTNLILADDLTGDLEQIFEADVLLDAAGRPGLAAGVVSNGG